MTMPLDVKFVLVYLAVFAAANIFANAGRLASLDFERRKKAGTPPGPVLRIWWLYSNSALLIWSVWCAFFRTYA